MNRRGFMDASDSESRKFASRSPSDVVSKHPFEIPLVMPTVHTNEALRVRPYIPTFFRFDLNIREEKHIVSVLLSEKDKSPIIGLGTYALT